MATAGWEAGVSDMVAECTWDVLRLLEAAVRAEASDLHLSAGEVPRLRVDGDLRVVAGAAALDESAMSGVLDSILPPVQRETFDRAGEVDASWEGTLQGLGRARFRVNAFCQRRGTALVLRRIPMRIPRLEDVGAPAVFDQLAGREEGLALVCGATGSGKSTTLAALVDAINQRRAAHIITIEDPVEFVHASRRSLVSQRELGADTADFASALRAALREDPDVILVGELRDLATMRLALAAAETGHLVLATLHARDAASAIDRFVGVFPQGERDLVRTSLAASLAAVVCQRLLPRVGGGRVAVHEVLSTTSAVRNLVRESRLSQLESAMQTGQAWGMQTFAQSIERLIALGTLPLGVIPDMRFDGSVG